MCLRKLLTALATFGFLSGYPIAAAEFRVPGLNYPAQIRQEVSILPGGRVLRPFGRQVLTGTAPFAISVSPSGKTIVTANIGVSPAIGVNRPSITVITPGKRDAAWNLADFSAEARATRGQAWQGLRASLAVVSDSAAWVAEGESGRVVELNLSTGSRKSAINLNSDSYSSSFTIAVAFASERNLLVALDQANSRAAIIDLKRGMVLGSVKIGATPLSLALSTDEKRLYVVNKGSLSIIDLTNSAAPKVTAEVPVAGTPSGIAVRGDEVYLSLAQTDAIVVVNVATGKVDGEIALRIPGLEAYRGIAPAGLAFEPKSGRLLVAEAGMNAVGVIDLVSRKVMGHVPVGWFPNSISVHNGQVYVASARGFGTGPSSPAHRIRMVGGGKFLSFETDTAVLRRGSVSAFAVPDDKELEHQTDIVLQANGFTPVRAPVQEKSLPPIRYVVVIQKGNRTFDEILGDVDRAGDKKVVLSERSFARFGMEGYVSGGNKRFSLHVGVTPNHHEMAQRWSFADNYYADSDYSEAVSNWLTGRHPDLASETSLLYDEAGNRGTASPRSTDGSDLWTHLKQHAVDFRNFSDETGYDQQRASQFIAALRKDYLEAAKPLPRFLLLSLPGDTAGVARPEDGYPYEASYVAGNDYALGRIVEFLSRTPWWKEMAIFVTESGAEGGADHLDSHRMLLLGVGPWFRSNYVSHTNASAPALLRTIFRLFDLPPLNLYDAAAGDLLDMFGAVPDSTPYELQAEDPRLWPNSGPSVASGSPP